MAPYALLLSIVHLFENFHFFAWLATQVADRANHFRRYQKRIHQSALKFHRKIRVRFLLIQEQVLQYPFLLLRANYPSSHRSLICALNFFDSLINFLPRIVQDRKDLS